MPKEYKKTYCMELIGEITGLSPSIKRLECKYTTVGVECLIEDTFDGQKYKLTLKPVFAAVNGEPGGDSDG